MTRTPPPAPRKRNRCVQQLRVPPRFFPGQIRIPNFALSYNRYFTDDNGIEYTTVTIVDKAYMRYVLTWYSYKICQNVHH